MMQNRVFSVNFSITAKVNLGKSVAELAVLSSGYFKPSLFHPEEIVSHSFKLILTIIELTVWPCVWKPTPITADVTVTKIAGYVRVRILMNR